MPKNALLRQICHFITGTRYNLRHIPLNEFSPHWEEQGQSGGSVGPSLGEQGVADDLGIGQSTDSIAGFPGVGNTWRRSIMIPKDWGMDRGLKKWSYRHPQNPILISFGRAEASSPTEDDWDYCISHPSTGTLRLCYNSCRTCGQCGQCTKHLAQLLPPRPKLSHPLPQPC